MNTCDDCPKQWDCYTPCEKVIAWQDLEREGNRIPDAEYVAKGIPSVSNVDKRAKFKK